MRAYSNDLRQRIIEAIQKNEESQADTATRFSVGLSFVEKLWRRFRETGSYEILPPGGGRRRLLIDAEQIVRQTVAAQPDIILAELAEQVALETSKPIVSKVVMCKELQRLKLPPVGSHRSWRGDRPADDCGSR